MSVKGEYLRGVLRKLLKELPLQNVTDWGILTDMIGMALSDAYDEGSKANERRE